MQSFDRNLFEKPLTVSDDKNLLVGIDTEIDILPDPLQVHIVASFGNTHRSILAHLANEVLPMDVSQSGVGINRGRKRRQVWQVRKSRTRRLVLTRKPLVRAFSICSAREKIENIPGAFSMAKTGVTPN